MILIKNKLSLQFLKYLFAILFSGIYLPQAVANNIHLSPLVDLGDSYAANVYWHKPNINPKNNQQYYIANSKGQFHLIDDSKIVKTPILNISQFYQEFVTLSAVVLHPNFSFNQQKGYNTFYTAHVEFTDQSIRTLRVKDKSLEHGFTYEVVIVEWQLNEANSLKVASDSKREILRIGINRPENSVIALRFNPYVKSWHDNFSHLYIALAYDATLKDSPLYSGAILRINPEKFGLRSYTTPSSNPFINHEDIPDELLVTGIQQIMQFVWQKNNDQQFIISHRFNKKVLLSQINYGDTLGLDEPEEVLLQGDIPLAKDSLILYRGREFKALRNKLLFIAKQDKHWQLQSVETSPPFQKSVINIFANNEIAENDQFSLFADDDDELMIFSRAHHVIQQLDNNASKDTNEVENPAFSESVSDTDNGYSSLSYIIWLVILFAGAMAWLAKNKKSQQAVKNLLHKNYARFELSVDNKKLALFHRHQQHAALTIDVNTITRSDVLLNDQHLLSIEAEISGFDDQLEQMLENKFIDEKRIKMVDDRTRKITLNITDDKGTVYGIFLYLREGNQRLTKAKFGQITDEIKEWCWFISAQLSPMKTGKRIVKIVQPQPIVSKPIQSKLIVSNPVASKPMTSQVSAADISLKVATDEKTNAVLVQESVQLTRSEDEIKPEITNNATETNTAATTGSNDTKLIEALSKLANLKAQGFLTEDEFVSAKSKILANLQKE